MISRWPDSRTALRKPGLKNGARRREVYEDRSARISILAGRSPPKPDTLQQTDHRRSRKIPCRRGGPYVFKTLERDKSITSAGVAEHKNDQPILLVPADQFAERGGLWAIVDGDDRQERTTYPVVDVVLIAPVLLSVPRSWKFQPPGLPEFAATMNDKRFLAALLQDHVRERLRVGIPMTLRLAVKEVKVDGVWQQKRGGRSVVEVISPKVA